MGKIRDGLCPLCGTQASFESKPAPTWFLRKRISSSVTHVSTHEPCTDYWFATAEKGMNGEEAHLTFLQSLSSDKKQFYSNTIRRMRESGAWLILYYEWSHNLIECRDVALYAAKDFDLCDVEIHHSGAGFDGQNLLLLLAQGDRLHPLRVHAADADVAEIRSKIYWLQCLDQYGVRVPRPQEGQNSEYLAWVESDQGGRWCVLYDWIQGEMYGHLAPIKRTRSMIENIAISMARMHELSTKTQFPDWFFRRSYGPDHISDFVRDRTYEQDHNEINAVLVDVISTMKEMDDTPQTFGLIHGEASDGNILVSGDSVAFIDFQRFGWGYFLTDIQKLMAAKMTEQEKMWFLNAYDDTFPLPRKFEKWFRVFAQARSILGHWT